MQSQTNLAWDALLDVDAGHGPLHTRLASAIRAAIRNGTLPPGAALPPTRALAEALGCSRWVATEAYDQLVAEGYLEARVGSGTRVRAVERPAGAGPLPARPRSGDAARYDLAPGLPDLRAFPRARWVAALRSASIRLPFQDLGYPPPGGHEPLRAVLAAYLHRVRGASAAVDDVTVCAGVTDGVLRACAALRRQGATRIAVEDPGWTRLREAIARTGLEIVPISVDGDGMRVDELARHRHVAAALVSPAHQFPTGAVLSPGRRAALLDWARGAGGIILEDDYDAEFRYDRRPIGTIQGVEPESVILLGSLSKTLSPALGIGWAVAPPRWSAALRDAGHAGPPALDQAALAELIESGGYDRHLRAARRRYRTRRDRLTDALAALLPECPVSGAAAGLHLLLHLPDNAHPPGIVQRAAQLNVRVADLAGYRIRPAPGPALVLGYGNLADAALPAAASALAAAVRTR